MSDIAVREARPADYSTIARIISEQNRKPETHCIQSSSTDDLSAIAGEIAELYAREELVFVVAELDGEMIGLIGCEFDQGVGRGWMRGPFLTRDFWASLPKALLDKLLLALPPTIQRLDSFLNQEHTQGHHFYMKNGFQQKGLVHVYQAQAAGYSGENHVPCPEIGPEQEPGFISLHDSAFPVTFIHGKGILEQLDQDHKLFVCANESALDGYIYVSVDKFGGEGYVEFIAVQPQLRGKGIGKALLLSALDWCFRTRRLAGVGLTVHDELVNAQGLYESVGFQHLYTGVNNRREW